MMQHVRFSMFVKYVTTSSDVGNLKCAVVALAKHSTVDFCTSTQFSLALSNSLRCTFLNNKNLKRECQWKTTESVFFQPDKSAMFRKDLHSFTKSEVAYTRVILEQ